VYLEEADLPVERVDGELKAVAAAGVGRGRRRLGPGRRSHHSAAWLVRTGSYRTAARRQMLHSTQSRARPVAAGWRWTNGRPGEPVMIDERITTKELGRNDDGAS